MSTAGQKLFGGGQIRLLVKRLHPAHTVRRRLVAPFDVTELSVGEFRLDSEGQQPALCHRAYRGLNGCSKAVGVANHVIGRQHHQHRVRIDLLGAECGQRDGRRRIARDRFEDDAVPVHTTLAALLRH